MNSVRLGIIGLGNMGQAHCRSLMRIDGLELGAVCDIDPGRLQRITDEYHCPGYVDPKAFLTGQRGKLDAVLIATPHYDHTTLGISALKQGYHLLVEKPISVHKADCEKLIRAHRDPSRKFAAMFNQRTNSQYQEIRRLITSGELGQIRRIQWTITDWFRSQQYYDSGGWRATWRGEGGGVLMNQCPHQLDLLQWLFGMPTRLRAFCQLGKHHQIEVEDQVTCYLEYRNGATGVFTTTTGEAPGVNRLEIAADNGLLIHDAATKTFRFLKNDKPVSRAIQENPGFRKPAVEVIDIDVPDTGRQHEEVLENFADAIRFDTPLIARAEEGINSVELANAMLLSSLTDKWVDLPLNARTYANRLRRLIRDSNFRKPEVQGEVVTSMEDSFS
ncbi:MAG: Gfo/Idh/MocA family protein [Pseudomonadota bacterium]